MFRGIRFFPDHMAIRFIARRNIFYAFSAFLLISSVVLFAVRGLNYGIDFTGGILIEIRTEQAADLAALRADLGGLGLGAVEVQEFGAADDVLIRLQTQEGGEAAQQQAVQKVRTVLGDTVAEYRRIETVGPKISDELFMDGLLAVLFAVVAIVAYIAFRFEWQFGVGAVVALVHDVVTTVGVFALTGIEFNLSTVAAVLTIAGYSINDTVVVFDRVRENLRKYKKMPLSQLFDMSVNDTLSRTTMTSFTTLLALFCLFTLGGEVIRGFSLAMIWGILVGTYSSICVALPLLLHLNLRGDDAADGEAEEIAAEETS